MTPDIESKLTQNTILSQEISIYHQTIVISLATAKKIIALWQQSHND